MNLCEVTLTDDSLEDISLLMCVVEHYFLLVPTWFDSQVQLLENV